MTGSATRGTGTSSPTRRRGPSALATLAVASITAAAVVLCFSGRQHALAIRQNWPPEADNMYLPSSAVLQRAALGHREMAADLVAARTYVYYGSQLSDKGPQKWLHFYLNAVADLDPWYQSIYLRGASMLVYRGNQVTLDGVQEANALLERGVKTFPDDWDMWFQLGFNRAFELPKLVAADDPRIPEWKRAGAEALRRATLFEGVPPWIPGLVANMMTEQGERELAIKHLERVYAATSDPQAREHIAGKLRRMQGEHFAASFEAEIKALDAMVQQRYPYAPEAFSIIAGPRQRPFLKVVDLLPLAEASPGSEHATSE